MTLEELAIVHDDLQNRLDQTVGVTFDDFFFATGIDRSDPRRKPSPLMIQQAAEKWNIDLAHSWMIGDSHSDIEAGQRAGTSTAYLVTVNTEEIPKATKVLHSLDEILKYI
jgi:D-glycero-D-manno-heptose 1,7-bisphosphate phosphatase